ncbi:hypothetical protein CMI47_10115 [Candidatus Pacearchaeota archaeon]|nr:hypothetical protein [Candidatus Pacearchaeota archaeon]|tara:strand:- start:2817 stop:3119 length:303 start_codon:yes stop_codon:yes gene_type:complete
MEQQQSNFPGDWTTNNEPTVSFVQFKQDYHTFRKMMGDRNNPLDLLDAAWKALLFMQLRAAVSPHPETTEQDIKVMDASMEALTEEWANRKTMMVFAGMV